VIARTRQARPKGSSPLGHRMRADVERFIGTPQAQHELRNIRFRGIGLGNEVEFGENQVEKSAMFVVHVLR